MPANYVLLERIELNASAASVTFSNIPQSGYTDLKVVVSCRVSDPDPGALVYLRPNGLTTNQTLKRLRGNGSVASSASSTAFYLDTDGAYNTANTFGNCEFYIPNYTSSDYKSFSGDGVAENNATESYMTMTANLWSSTSAITSLSLFPSSSSNFVQYSTFSLYGLAAVGTTPVIAPKASGGNIQTDGTYWYHTFLSTGTFTPATGLTCDALLVAGGGSGGGGRGGGGGAGGVVYTTNQTLSLSTAYTVTVGAGGAAVGNSNINGNQGSNSTLTGGLLSITAAVGGGYGGSAFTGQPGGNGGSGGGGPATTAGGTATSGQGYAGGSGASSSGNYRGAGGGGGASAVGTDGQDSTNGGGTGGAGTSTYSSWASATSTGVSGYYAGGGGGGSYGTTTSVHAGGAGGGGNSGYSSGLPTNGTVNTGSGGGGASNGASNPAYDGGAAAGGSGIVIVRYLVA